MDPIEVILSVQTAAALEQVKNFLDKTKDALESQIPTSVEKAKNKLDELGRKMMEVSKIVEQDKAKYEELGRKKEELSAKEKKAVEQEMENLRRIITSRELEIKTIEAKRVKVEEVIQLASAGSDAEREAIKKTTDARLAEIGTIKDQQKAHEGVTQAVDAGGNAITSYFNRFLTITAVIQGMKMLVEATVNQRNELEKAADAAERLRNLTQSQFNTAKGFATEFGLFTAEGQTQAEKTVQDISQQTNIPQEDVSKAAAGIAPALKRAGITDLNSPQLKGLISNAALMQTRGIDASNLQFYVQEKLQQNPKFTGEELNQQMADMIQDTGGSPASANQFLSVYSQDQARFRAAGMGPDTVKRLYTSLLKTTPQQEIPTIMRQYAQGLDRLLGQGRKDMLGEFMNMNNIPDEMQKVIREQAGIMPEEKLPSLIPQIERMRKAGTGVPELDDVFEEATKTGKFDIPKFASVTAGLSPEKRERVARLIAGPRNVVSLGQALNFFDAPAATKNAPPIPFPTHPAETMDAEKQQAEAEAASSSPVTPGASFFQSAVKQEKEYLTKHPEEYPAGVDPNSFMRNRLGVIADVVSNGTDADKFAVARVAGRKFYQLAGVLARAKKGEIKLSQDEIASIRTTMGMLSISMGQDSGGHDYMLDVMEYGSGKEMPNGPDDAVQYQGPETREDVMKGGEERFLEEHINSPGIPNYILNPESSGHDLYDANKILRKYPEKPAAPTTQPSIGPTSINYHIRQTNYGYGYDQVGGMEEVGNRFG